MATRGAIGIENADGTITAIYCHWDNYLSWNGQMLLDHYDREKTLVLVALGEALERFSSYGDRLERAHRHVREGRTEWIARPTVDSYRGVWFELHEHLLVTLDRDRSPEPLPQYAPTPNGESR